jgi:thiol-disulfide isomerase/thioredoxin
MLARLMTAALVALTFGPAAAVAAPAAPGFRVRLLDSPRSFDSRDRIGKKIVVLRFQASWCRSCVKESVAFSRLADHYRGRDVEFLALQVQDALADARRFVDTQRPTYLIALDPTLTVGNRYGMKATPYTVVIDRRGELVARLAGESAPTWLPKILDELLAPKPRRR